MYTKFVRLVILLLIPVLHCLNVAANPASPTPFRFLQPDGSTVTLVLHGDEFFNWTTDLDGRVMEKGADGFYRYTGATSSSMRRQAATVAKANRAAFRRQSSDRQFAPSGKKRFLIILVEFKDKKFTTKTPNDAFYRLANQNNYSENGSIGSVSDYYTQNSYGAFQPEFDVVGPVTVERSATDFPEEDDKQHSSFAFEVFQEAMQLADPDIDYANYDLDKNGYIDNVYFIYAGEAQSNGGGPDTIWPHAWRSPSGVVMDGVRLSSYACSSELVSGKMCGIGTVCHEFGHVLGLPDLYDTDSYENGSALHPGSYSLMASGNHNNGGYIPSNLTAFERHLLGWLDIPLLEEGTVSLSDIGNNPATGYIPTDIDGEWFVFETRDGQGWDTGLPPGLVVFHLDRSDTRVGWMTAGSRWRNQNGINDFESHPCYVPLIAAGKYNYNNNNIPFPGYGDVTSHTFSGWSGNKTGYRMTDIAYENSVTTFSLEYYFKTVTGTVRDNYGNPLSDVSVTVTPISDNPAFTKGSRTSLRAARRNADDAVSSVQTRQDGTFEMVFDSQDDAFELYAEKDDYLPWIRRFSFNEGNRISLDPELKLFIVNHDATLRKHTGEFGNYWGWSTSPVSFSASVLFTAEELRAGAGTLLSSIDLVLDGTSAEKLSVFVDMDDDRVFFHPVDLSKFEWGQWYSVDVSDEHFIIPQDKAIRIGYAAVNVNSDHPLVSDNGPYVEGGFFYLRDVLEPSNDWRELTGVNLLLSATLDSVSTIDGRISLPDIGINYISPFPKDIRPGETLALSIVESPSNPPTGVRWYCDGKECAASVRAQSGTHTVRAVLSFKDGHKETLETQYQAR